MALVRLWDKNPAAVRMDEIGRELQKPLVIRALAEIRNRDSEDTAAMEIYLAERVTEAMELIDKYATGTHAGVLRNLQNLRHERLAHRQTAPTRAGKDTTATAEQVEELYQDMSGLIARLSSIVLACAYDPQQSAEVWRHHARFFWASVRGERTEGHPNYWPR